MDNTNRLATDWLEYARASLNSRIQDTARATEKVLFSVQEIANQLNEKHHDLDALLSLQQGEPTSTEVLHLLHQVLQKLDEHDALAQLIAPLFLALQFEDRTRQKLEGILGILGVWLKYRNLENVPDSQLASQLMQYVVTMEQQEILSRYFPEYISDRDSAVTGNIDLF